MKYFKHRKVIDSDEIVSDIPPLHPLIRELYSGESFIGHNSDRGTIFYRMGYGDGVNKRDVQTEFAWQNITNEEYDFYSMGYKDGKSDLNEWMQTPPEDVI